MRAGVEQAVDATRGRDYAAFRGYVHERAEHFFQLRKANSLETVPSRWRCSRLPEAIQNGA